MQRLPGIVGCLLLLSGCAASLPAPAPIPAARPLSPAVAERVETVRELAESAARRHGLEPALVLGVVQVESRFNPEVRSSAGARGLMQLMPRTAAALARRLGREGEPIDDPGFNLEAGCLYLSLLLKRFDGDLNLALAAYNTGPSRVAGWRNAGRELPDYSRRYVEAVLAARRIFAEGGSPAVNLARRPEPDRGGLRALLRRQQAEHPEPPPASAPATQPAPPPQDEAVLPD